MDFSLWENDNYSDKGSGQSITIVADVRLGVTPLLYMYIKKRNLQNLKEGNGSD
ncbi:hypothetical protein BCV72DRAFT_84465 [Rhizopus microsporus var. microsporus]|uniref:Uncharacterized protein n=1 Tax=Rhizopus microsporus var. microsporus TaxID=86635 RepID=A0A1X0R9M0_RHIZD|nr:hypothetical protein BCV72DRAFT_84465 [Rhizopus microsporus var. microsporus]